MRTLETIQKQKGDAWRDRELTKCVQRAIRGATTRLPPHASQTIIEAVARSTAIVDQMMPKA